MKNSESDDRRVMANETGGYEVILVCTSLKNLSMDLKDLGRWKAGLQESRQLGGFSGTWIGKECVHKA